MSGHYIIDEELNLISKERLNHADMEMVKEEPL